MLWQCSQRDIGQGGNLPCNFPQSLTHPGVFFDLWWRLTFERPNMPHMQRLNAMAGFLPAGVVVTMIAYEYSGIQIFAVWSGAIALIAVAVFALSVSASRLAFIVIAMILSVWAILVRDDWWSGIATALQRGAMVMALFTALTAIRNAAMSSAEIVETGRFLARQRPGLRYTALTIGGHLFGLIMVYGSISLLGGLAAESASQEPDPKIRRLRLRRMMVAIQRGFASTLCWSPLGFSMAITLAIVPGASWGNVAIPCIISALMMLVVGWGLDAMYKPVTRAAPIQPTEADRWGRQLRPLLLLLAVIMLGVALLHVVTGVEVIGAVMSLVPVVAFLWIGLQKPPAGQGRLAHVGHRALQFLTRELPAYRGEMLLLFMAGFIGAMGSFLLLPIIQKLGVDLTAIPPLVILVLLVWIIPITGQIGMNPILAVSLLVPLLPSPQMMEIHPAALVTAITGGWALSGATSPFTASVLLSAALSGVSTRQAGIGWNGTYTLVMGAILSLWVLLLAFIL